jgi:8-oxo-dGTP diphosphatase
MEYVAGLLYNDDGSKVALILKNRPAWQAGLYNAIGGKIEPGELSFGAMNREFIEEAGVDLDWDLRITLVGPGFKVHFFSYHDSEALEEIRTCTDEVIGVFDTYDLPDNIIPNLRWIIPMLDDDSVEGQTIKVSG